jgi:iron(III) transport system ATP-binding protein
MNDLEILHVTKHFAAVTALRDATFACAAGSFTAILGPSGCGKTTLLRIIAGFESPTSGSVHIGGTQVAGDDAWVDPEHRHVGIVPQEAALFPHLSVQDNVGFGLRRPERRGRQVRDLLAMVGLADMHERRPHELSGGQQQRVALARCLATRPQVVLLDEPFSALDATLRIALRNETRTLLKEAGTTTVLVTHDQDEALSLADHVALMKDGHIVQFASPGELYSLPVSPWAASFVGDANLFPVLSASNGAETVETAIGTLRVRGDFRTSDLPALALLRPEQVELVTSGGHRGIVTDVVFHGHDHLVTVQLERTQCASGEVQHQQMVVRAPAYVHPVIGEAVQVSVAGEALLLSASVNS